MKACREILDAAATAGDLDGVRVILLPQLLQRVAQTTKRSSLTPEERDERRQELRDAEKASLGAMGLELALRAAGLEAETSRSWKILFFDDTQSSGDSITIGKN
jgi:hypothetical protein